MQKFLLAALALAVVGCAEKLEPTAEPPAEGQASVQAAPKSGSGGIGIVSPAAGGVSPVTNSDSVAGGGGGGVQQAAKQQAKDAASKVGGGNLDQSGGY